MGQRQALARLSLNLHTAGLLSPEVKSVIDRESERGDDAPVELPVRMTPDGNDWVPAWRARRNYESDQRNDDFLWGWLVGAIAVGVIASTGMQMWAAVLLVALVGFFAWWVAA
jgi:hypothetical protein